MLKQLFEDIFIQNQPAICIKNLRISISIFNINSLTNIIQSKLITFTILTNKKTRRT